LDLEAQEHAPRAWKNATIRLGHAKCALSICKEAYVPQAYVMRPKHMKMRGRNRHFIRFYGFSPRF